MDVQNIATDEVVSTEMVIDQVEVKASIKGEDAKNNYDIIVNELPSESKEIVDEDGNTIGSQEFEVFFEIPADSKENNSSVSMLPTNFDLFSFLRPKIVHAAAKGSSETSGGITAKVNVDYTKNSKGQIKLSRVYGSWVPKSSMYYVTNRKVTYGVNYLRRTGSLYPSSNSFSVSTGWGYYDAVSGSSGAFSSARGNVQGMSGTHLIEIEVKI